MLVLYTIGYEGTDIERFVSTLNAARVQRLADVRAVPLSRKNGFSKRSLSARLEAEGIEYLPFQPLGDPKAGRDAARAGRYDLFRAIYSEHLDSVEAKSALKTLVAVAEEKATCLLCFERDPATCHRSIVAQQLTDYGFEVFDLFGDRPEKYGRNAHRLPRYDSRKGAAAA
jgi:uncharacterized protein (DUF488 family)